MKTIITSIALSASLLLIAAPRLVAAESATAPAKTDTTGTVLVHPKFKGAVGAGWVRVKATQAPTPVPAGTCLRPRRTSLKGALGSYAPGQKIMHCKAAGECGSPKCPGHVTCVVAG